VVIGYRFSLGSSLRYPPCLSPRGGVRGGSGGLAPRASEGDPGVLAAFLRTGIHGLRLGGAIGKDGEPALRWGDVRLVERWLSVQSRTRRLKTSSSARDVPIPDVLVQMLAAHRIVTPGGPADAVFPYPFTHGQAQRVFRSACEAAELHDVRVHDLRHTFAVHWVMAGLPLARLQKILGHRTPAMTMRYARHAPEAYFAEDAARLSVPEKVLNRRGAPLC
jgi:Phage integrase family